MKRDQWKRRTGFIQWAIPALLVLLSLILYWPFVGGGKALFWGTPLLQFWPWRQFAAEELHAGRLSLWNPYAGSGTPLLADHQSAILYPPNLIFWVLPVPYAMGLSLIFHAILAGWTMYALARDLGLARFGGIVAALAFMFSGYMVARGSFLTEISALPWLPLLWLLVRRLVHRRRLSDLAHLSLTIALQFLAGHAQTWFYSLWTVGLYALWQALKRPVSSSEPPSTNQPRRGLPFAIRRPLFAAGCVILAILWGVALAAVQFLPTLELSQLAGRAGRADWETYSLQYSFWPWRLLTFLAPDFFGNPVRGDYWGYATYWEDAGHIGLLPFILAILAAGGWIRNLVFSKNQVSGPLANEIPFWASLAALALLLAMGKNTPLYMLLYHYVPGFSSFQAPARLLCIYTPAMALLAGIGADGLIPSKSFGRRIILAWMGGLGILLAGAVARLILPDVKATFISATIQMAIWLVASLGLLWWGNALPLIHPRRRYWEWATVLFVAADLIVAGYSLNPAIGAELYALQTRIGAFLKQDGLQGRTFYLAASRQAVLYGRYLDFGNYGPSDVAHWRDLREDLLPDLGTIEHLPSANSFEPLVEGRYYTLLQTIEGMPRDQAWRILGMMNVAYVLDPADSLDQEIVYRSPSVNVYRNSYALGRAYVVGQARAVSDAGEALAAISSPQFDPSQQVILEHSPVLNSPPPTRSFQLDILPSPPDQVKIHVVLSAPGYLVLADTFYPGWRATVDGRPAEIWRANYAFRAVALDSGEHQVVFEYKPRSFTLGWICSAAALGAVLAVGLKAWSDSRSAI